MGKSARGAGGRRASRFAARIDAIPVRVARDAAAASLRFGAVDGAICRAQREDEESADFWNARK